MSRVQICLSLIRRKMSGRRFECLCGVEVLNSIWIRAVTNEDEYGASLLILNYCFDPSILGYTIQSWNTLKWVCKWPLNAHYSEKKRFPPPIFIYSSDEGFYDYMRGVSC